MISTFEEKQNLEFNDKFAKGYDLLENDSRNIFITGKAGTGKSTLLEYFRAHTSKKIVVLAPTGVAAVNIKGQTIHSFFCFRPDVVVCDSLSPSSVSLLVLLLLRDLDFDRLRCADSPSKPSSSLLRDLDLDLLCADLFLSNPSTSSSSSLLLVRDFDLLRR